MASPQTSRKKIAAPFVRRVIFVVLLACLVAALFVSLNQEYESFADRAPIDSVVSAKLGDGCFHVFLDAGANIGIHSRFLFEPEKYPNATNAQLAFEEAFGKERDNRDVCSFGFEPNPKHWPRQKALQEAYAAKGLRYSPFRAGLGDTEGGNLTFYHNDASNSQSEWGFSTVNRGGRARKSEVAPLIHFARWIRREIMNRKMPDVVYGKYSDIHSHNNGREGKVAMKLDIEGMEFLVVPSLLYTGVMCQAIDVIWGEYHTSGHAQYREALDNRTGQGALAPFDSDWKVAREYFNNFWKVMKTVNPADCRSQWLDMFDVEDYVLDGVPLPSVKSRM